MAVHGCIICPTCGGACPLCGTCSCSSTGPLRKALGVLIKYSNQFDDDPVLQHPTFQTTAEEQAVLDKLEKQYKNVVAKFKNPSTTRPKIKKSRK